ncbi:MAG: hypothetical protein CTY34_00115 [Methylobacter sp.]|nr:MAG: hypothetical protein CTY34_00115 [Methylobacter sp.]
MYQVICLIAVLALTVSPAKSGQNEKPSVGLFPSVADKAKSTEPFQKKPDLLQKMDKNLLDLEDEFQAYSAKGSKAGFLSRNRALMIKSNHYVVIDVIAALDSKETVQALQNVGCRQISSFQRVISAECPIDALKKLALEATVKFMRPAMMRHHTGLVNSQGDTALRADLARSNLGLSGSGITIGTLSDSYNCNSTASTSAASDVASGDLPAGVLVLNDLAVGTPGCTDEGRAMMQLEHDVAPNAALAFHTANLGAASFANGILALRNNANSDIIVDDLIYLDEPMFQDGIIAQAVDQVVNAGAKYFSSAGNETRESYQQNFRASGLVESIFGGELHDFDSGAGVDVYQRITVPPGISSISFQWSEPFFSVSGSPGSASDYDIWICTSDTQPVDSANCPFQGPFANVGGDPVELVAVDGGQSGATLYLAMSKFTGTANNFLKYIIFNPSVVINEYATNSSTLFGHANSEGAEAVGAAAYNQTPAFGVSPPILESFSSAGGTQILFDITGAAITALTRQKPEIVAPDGGNTTFFFSDSTIDADNLPNFFGTSAAAPHAAAVAALILEANGGTASAIPSAIYTALENTALDMNTSGFDFDSGYGFIQADAAVIRLADPDGDAVLNRIEITGCSSEIDKDSDDDGLSDGDEDTNHDGLVNNGETDPCNTDTDNDGIQDGTELGRTAPIADPDGAGPLSGTNITVFIADADPSTTTTALLADTDGDGFSDGAEDINHNGRFDSGESNPLSAASIPSSLNQRTVPALPAWAMALLALGLLLQLYIIRQVLPARLRSQR